MTKPTVIVDLGRARRGAGDLVHFAGDVTVLRPVEGAKSNRLLLMDLVNRGRRVTPGMLNRAAVDIPPIERIRPGDGFLMRHGWSLAWCGWQWDVPPGPGRMRFSAPLAVTVDGGALPGTMQLRFQLPAPAAEVELTDQHVGPLGRHAPIATVDVEDRHARLLVRDT